MSEMPSKNGAMIMRGRGLHIGALLNAALLLSLAAATAPGCSPDWEGPVISQ